VPAVQAALDFIGNPDCDWDTWTRIGLATKQGCSVLGMSGL
jgi:hypothetical protein